MPDLVVTCPAWFWRDWIAEGDAVGEEPTGEDWHWYMRCRRSPPIEPGERLYVIAHGLLRGFAPVVRVERTDEGWAIVRQAGAVALTIPEPIKGFRGFRYPWWSRESEVPFPDWKTRGVRV